MIIGDVLLDRFATRDELRAAVAAAFSLSEDRVELVSGMENAPPLTGVTVDVTALRGEFPWQLGIFVPEILAAELVDVAAAIAKRLGARALIPGEAEDPYRMLLVEPDGALVEVEIDAQSLDENGEYRLALAREA